MKAQLVLRAMGLAFCAFGIATYPRAGTNLNWPAAFVCSALVGPILFLWLMGQRASAVSGWSTLISWNEPVFPMHRYPFSFWLFAGQSMAVGGIAAMIVDIGTSSEHRAFGATFLLLNTAS